MSHNKQTTAMPADLRDQVWNVASSIEWTETDWHDFHESITTCFTRIAARHAQKMISKGKGTKTNEETGHDHNA